MLLVLMPSADAVVCPPSAVVGANINSCKKQQPAVTRQAIKSNTPPSFFPAFCRPALSFCRRFIRQKSRYARRPCPVYFGVQQNYNKQAQLLSPGLACLPVVGETQPPTHRPHSRSTQHSRLPGATWMQNEGMENNAAPTWGNTQHQRDGTRCTNAQTNTATTDTRREGGSVALIASRQTHPCVQEVSEAAVSDQVSFATCGCGTLWPGCCHPERNKKRNLTNATQRRQYTNTDFLGKLLLCW